MAGRIRTLKPEWLDDERLNASGDGARVLSAALILLADDHGCGRASLSHIAAHTWSHELVTDPAATVQKARESLETLMRISFVRLYEVDGQSYFWIRQWEKHQRVQHPGGRRVPAPPPENTEETSIRETLTKVSGESHETLAPDLRSPISDLRSPTTEIATHVAVPVSTEPVAEAAPSPPSEAPTPAADPTPSADVRRIYDRYLVGWRRVVAGHRPPALDAKRIKLIKTRLKAFPVDALLEAVEGIWESSWHVERRDQGLTSIDFVLRDAEHVEKFAALAPQPSAPRVETPPPPMRSEVVAASRPVADAPTSQRTFADLQALAANIGTRPPLAASGDS